MLLKGVEKGRERARARERARVKARGGEGRRETEESEDHGRQVWGTRLNDRLLLFLLLLILLLFLAFATDLL
jgi:hypothetical protein